MFKGLQEHYSVFLSYHSTQHRMINRTCFVILVPKKTSISELNDYRETYCPDICSYEVI